MIGMFRCRGLSTKISMGIWPPPNDSPMLKRLSRDFRLGVMKAMSKTSVASRRASQWVCSLLFKYISFSPFVIPLRKRPD